MYRPKHQWLITSHKKNRSPDGKKTHNLHNIVLSPKTQNQNQIPSLNMTMPLDYLLTENIPQRLCWQNSNRNSRTTYFFPLWTDVKKEMRQNLQVKRNLRDIFTNCKMWTLFGSQSKKKKMVKMKRIHDILILLEICTVIRYLILKIII